MVPYPFIRGMALADNATAAADLEWNEGLIAAEADKFDLDLNLVLFSANGTKNVPFFFNLRHTPTLVN